MPAPILVTVYNRKEHLEKCITSLLSNPLASESTLYIASDAPSNPSDKDTIENIRRYITNIQGFRRVVPIFNEKNLGSYDSALNAVDIVFSKHNSFIFLEDDIEVSRYFLEYLNDGLEVFEHRKDIFSICAYTPSKLKIPQNYHEQTYLWSRFCAWGFATWRDRWNLLDLELKNFDVFINDNESVRRFNEVTPTTLPVLTADRQGRIKAMDMRIAFNMFENDWYALYPIKSLIRNNGYDGTGEHCGNAPAFSRETIYQQKIMINRAIKTEGVIYRARKKHHTNSIRARIVSLVRKSPTIYRLLKSMHTYCKQIAK